MLLDWAEVDARVIPTACARVCKGPILDRTVKVWAILILRENRSQKKEEPKNQLHDLASNWIPTLRSLQP